MLKNRRSVLYRKKYQRDVNKIVRDYNQSIKFDWLWHGRFILTQRAAYFHPYEDKSGAEFLVVLQLKDNKTGKVETEVFNNYSFDYRVIRWVNECITTRWKVWNENPNPNQQARLEGRFPRLEGRVPN